MTTDITIPPDRNGARTMKETTMTQQITREQADAVLAAVVKQRHFTAEEAAAEFAESGIRLTGEGPKVIMDWTWVGPTPTPSIVWEEGPFEWAHLFPYGGIEEEFGFKVKDVSGDLPAGVHIEAATSWALHLYVDGEQ